jgi:hypothetical protein
MAGRFLIVFSNVSLIITLTFKNPPLPGENDFPKAGEVKQMEAY